MSDFKFDYDWKTKLRKDIADKTVNELVPSAKAANWLVMAMYQEELQVTIENLGCGVKRITSGGDQDD